MAVLMTAGAASAQDAPEVAWNLAGLRYCIVQVEHLQDDTKNSYGEKPLINFSNIGNKFGE